MGLRQINFQGNEYILVGEKEGAIATKEQYVNGLMPFAYLFPDGEIRRFGKKIGTIKDIVFGDIIELQPTEEAFEDILDFLFCQN